MRGKYKNHTHNNRITNGRCIITVTYLNVLEKPAHISLIINILIHLL